MPYEALDDMDGLDYNTSGFRCKHCGKPTIFLEEHPPGPGKRSKGTVVLSCTDPECPRHYSHKSNANRRTPRAGRIRLNQKWALNKKLEEC